ncbi:MAG: hypothetical protein OXF11_00860 [Deltaproteobacteria bacterium]|nr:hypothetical protein [Deltaproteobacteria bacterium]
MPTIVTTLQQNPEPFPDWLKQPSPRFDHDSFFGSRTVYYPGCGTDGHPVAICNPAHAAHTFVYVDYRVSEQTVRDCVYRRTGPGVHGYEAEHEEEVAEAILHPGGWTPHVAERELDKAADWADESRFRLYLVLKRDKDHDDTHGPERFAILFIGGDGHAMYDALYCQEDGTRPPFLLLFHDYGWDENYDKFGADGLLERIAFDRGVYPEWLLVGLNERQFEPWEGYLDVGAEPARGGMHRKPRALFHRAHWPAVRLEFR